MYSLQPNSWDLLSRILPIQQGVAVPSLWMRRRYAITAYVNKMKWQEPLLTALVAGLPCNQVPPRICFSASQLSSCIVGVKIAVGGG